MLWHTSVNATVNVAACPASLVMWAAFGTAVGRLLVNSRACLAFSASIAGLLALSLVPAFW